MIRLFTKILVFILLISYAFLSSAQKENNIWYFGQNAGLDFSNGTPVPLLNGKINTMEGCAVACNSAGQLLFYTDGVSVWNANHQQMPNGFGLGGNWSTSQSALIIPKPGSATLYYIFTPDVMASGNGVKYSEVDMGLENGAGDISSNKNIALHSVSCEKLTAVKHCNNKDYWIITHDWDSNKFRTFLVTSAGVNTVGVISSCGISFFGWGGNAIGHIKVSPDGTRLASTTSFLSTGLELFDFNRSTGIVSGGFVFQQPFNGAYGIEFSPDGSKLYCSDYKSKRIYQYNLCAGTNSLIAASESVIAQFNGHPGALQKGPDQKIYVAIENSQWLGVINNPNAAGNACGFVHQGLYLGGQYCLEGLPNFMTEYSKSPVITYSITCLKGNFVAPKGIISKCSGANSIKSLSWNFGDPSSGAANVSSVSNPVHMFTKPGTYSINLIINYNCGADTIKNTIIINAPEAIQIKVAGKDTICKGGNNLLSVSEKGKYTWCNGVATYSNLVSPSASTSYSISISDSIGCIYKGHKSIVVNPSPQPFITGKDTVCSGDKTVLTANSNCNNYYWSTGEKTSSITVSPVTTSTYQVIASNEFNCAATAKFTVHTPTLNISGEDSICANEQTILYAGSGREFLWNTGEPFSFINVAPDKTTTYSVTITTKKGCTLQASFTVKVFPLPAITASATRLQGITSQLNASGGETYTWAPGTDLSCPNCPNPFSYATENTEYCVNVGTDKGCTHSACVTLTISSAYIPNAFTPNKDNLNDVFLPVVREVHNYKLMVFDNWGEEIFESKDQMEGWNGTFKGEACEEGIYTYKLFYADNDNEQSHQVTGKIMLLRED